MVPQRAAPAACDVRPRAWAALHTPGGGSRHLDRSVQLVPALAHFARFGTQVTGGVCGNSALAPVQLLGAQPKPPTPPSLKRLRVLEAGLQKAHYAAGADPSSPASRSLAQQLGEVGEMKDDRQKQFQRTGL